MSVVEGLLVSAEAQKAYLGTGDHAHSPWFRLLIDGLRVCAAYGQDPLVALGAALAAENRVKSLEVEVAITKANRTIEPKEIRLCRT